MATFRYQGRDQNGKQANGEIEAASAEAVAATLSAKGVTPVRIEKTASSPSAKKKTAGARKKSEDRPVDVLAWFKKVELEELIVFSRQMYTLSRAGITLNRALRGLASMAKNPLLQDTLESVAGDLEAGQDLATGMRHHPKVFSPLVISLVRSGEATGNLDVSFLQIAKALELERDTRRRIKSATRYPIFVITAMAVAVGVVTVFVIPAFAKMFASFGAELPWQTRALIASSNFMVIAWPWILGGLVAFFFLFRQYGKTTRGRYRIDRMKLRLPVMGSIIERIHLGRFSRTFATLFRAGLPVTQALRIVSEAVGNSYVQVHTMDMISTIERGDSLTKAAVASGLFTPLILQMLSVGEETGEVDRLMDEVADFYDEEVDYALKRLTDAIEPILAVFLGGLVIILALGVFLPMWDMASVV